MALGAKGTDVVGLIVGRSMLFVGAGLLIGIGGSIASARLTGTLLAGVGPTDPVTFLSVTVVFKLVALLASAVPARRASQVDPMVSVRYE
jgi:putative ABC transport system permease protein